MGLHKRINQPYVITRGADTALPLDVYDDEQAQQTATAATVSVLLGSKVLVDSASATTLGPPVSYTLAGGTTSAESLSDAVLVRWSLTIGGVVYPFERAGYMVRQAFDMTLTDADLLSVDRNLANYRNSGDSTFAWAVTDARQRIERRLLKKGRRPWLIFDNWALFDAFRFEALAAIYGSARTGIDTTSHAAALTHEYAQKAEMEFASVQFRYDEAETGTIDSTTTEGPSGTVTLSAGPGGRGFYGRRWVR